MWNDDKVKVINFEIAEFDYSKPDAISEAIKINKIVLGIPDDFDLLSVNICPTHKNNYLVTIVIKVY